MKKCIDWKILFVLCQSSVQSHLLVYQSTLSLLLYNQANKSRDSTLFGSNKISRNANLNLTIRISDWFKLVQSTQPSTSNLQSAIIYHVVIQFLSSQSLKYSCLYNQAHLHTAMYLSIVTAKVMQIEAQKVTADMGYRRQTQI